MNLDQLTIEIRPRRAWEAVDLGLLMARRWWWPMMKVWLLLTLPLFVLLNFLPGDWLWLSYTLIWWLKPIFERPLLLILSQAVFNQAPDTRGTLKAFPRLARQQLFLSLTWRRFSPSRSMDLPVIQLEGLHGARRQERLAVLHREESSPATWLTIIGIHMEGLLGIGLALLLYALVPSEIHIDWMRLFTSQDSTWFVLLTNACNYLAICMVAPFYVACGFSLYLNRRINLEAWDIDIAFQRIIRKRRPTHDLPLAALLVTFLCGIGFIHAPDTLAQENPSATTNTSVIGETTNAGREPFERDPVALDRANARSSIDAILAEDTFHQKQILRYPVFFEDKEKGKPEEWDNDFLKWFADLFKSAEALARVASWLEILLWAGVLCLIFLVVFRYRHWLAAYLPHRVNQPAKRNKPATLFGMDVARESLPDDVSASALAFWYAGEQRAALALLYRASLSRLLDGGLEIEEGHTEAECLRQAHNFADNHPHARAALDYFARLTRVWQRLAYGHIAPDNQVAEHLCQQWNGIWRVSGETRNAEVKHDHA